MSIGNHNQKIPKIILIAGVELKGNSGEPDLPKVDFREHELAHGALFREKPNFFQLRRRRAIILSTFLKNIQVWLKIGPRPFCNFRNLLLRTPRRRIAMI
jgi:hypothetical protein